MFICCVVEEGCNPDVECTEWIREHYVFLLDSLDSVISGLINYLYQFKVFDQAEADDVRTQRTSAKQNERLLSILGRKSLDKIKLFFAALDMTGQGHIRNEIGIIQICHYLTFFNLPCPATATATTTATA